MAQPLIQYLKEAGDRVPFWLTILAKRAPTTQPRPLTHSPHLDFNRFSARRLREAYEHDLEEHEARD